MNRYLLCVFAAGAVGFSACSESATKKDGPASGLADGSTPPVVAADAGADRQAPPNPPVRLDGAALVVDASASVDSSGADGAPPSPAPLPDAGVAPPLMTAPAGTSYVYVGSDRGIDILYMDAAGVLTPKSWVGYDPSMGFMNASFMAISDRYVYVVSDAQPPGVGQGKLFAFLIDPVTGGLGLLNSVSTGGPQSVHVSVDKQRKRAFVANFQDDATMPTRPEINTVAAFALLPDGKIGNMLGGLVKAGRNPHAIYFPEPLGKMAYVPTLFDGTITQLKMSDTGLSDPDLSFSLLAPAPDAGVAMADAGAAGDAGNATGDARPPARCTRSARNQGGRNPGPRHMEFSKDGKLAYLITEFGASVNLFNIAASDGKLQGSGLMPFQDISVVPPDLRPQIDFVSLGVRGAEVYLHPSGKWLYASVRFDRCDYGSNGAPAFQADREDGYVTRFVVAPGDGKLSNPQYVKVNKEPRYFTITPDGNFLVVAGQRTAADNVLVFKIDTAGDGKLSDTPVGKATTGKTWDNRDINQSRSIVVFKKP